jgi:dihydrodipicolinate synthase/N-acetylneuraminate lyase
VPTRTCCCWSASTRRCCTASSTATPEEVLRLVTLCRRAAAGDGEARRLAQDLAEALTVLSTFDEGPDLVLHYKQLMVLEGHDAYRHPVFAMDRLSDSQSAYLTAQWQRFRAFWEQWPGKQDA